MNSEKPPNPPEPKPAVLTESGMMIAPYGEYSFTELKAHYAEQIEKNRNAGLFLLRGMTLLSDLRAALIECKKRGKAAAALLSVDGDLTTAASLPADAALITLQSMGLAAFGVFSDSEDTLADAVERLAPLASIPLFFRAPNEAVGGRILRAACEAGLLPLGNNAFQPPGERETALLLANERQAFFLESDTTEISEPIPCNDGMETELFAASQESFDVLKIEIDTPDDAVAFAENAAMALLPVMFGSGNDTALMLALMLYQGRALVDRTCGLSEAALEKAVRKYGAILY